MGRQGTTPKPKYNGILGEKVINKGVLQGGPLSDAYLFIIYAGSTMGAMAIA